MSTYLDLVNSQGFNQTLKQIKNKYKMLPSQAEEEVRLVKEEVKSNKRGRKKKEEPIEVVTQKSLINPSMNQIEAAIGLPAEEQRLNDKKNSSLSIVDPNPIPNPNLSQNIVPNLPVVKKESTIVPKKNKKMNKDKNINIEEKEDKNSKENNNEQKDESKENNKDKDKQIDENNKNSQEEAKKNIKNIGTKEEVYYGSAKRTSGRLTKNDLTLNKNGKVVSIKKSEHAKKLSDRLKPFSKANKDSDQDQKMNKENNEPEHKDEAKNN